MTRPIKTPSVAAEGAGHAIAAGERPEHSAGTDAAHDPYQNIPLELRQLRQWVCWRYDVVKGRRTKVPFMASISAPGTWGTFDDAVNASRVRKLDGIGFVLTDDDPYTGIDLDNKPENPATPEELVVHQRILDQFESYTERSVGGNGYHIIIKGKINGGNGRDRGHIGVYSSQRYLTFTGEVVRDAPIVEAQSLLNGLIAGMPSTDSSVELVQVDSDITDEELHEKVLNAANGEKYAQLCRGDWKVMGYPSASEADLALISILAFRTTDNAQVRRMFRNTMLGKRAQHVSRNYHIDKCLKIVRADEPSAEQIEASRAFAAAIHDSVAPSNVQLPDFPAELLQLPHGLGLLQRWILGTMTYPSPATAGITALAVLAHFAMTGIRIDSRRGLGLNEQFLILAPSGFGKEELRSPFAELEFAVRNFQPDNVKGWEPAVLPILQFSAPASLQGMHTLLETHHAQTFLADEFAEWLGHTARDPHKQQALGYIMQAYSKAFSTLAAPAAKTNYYRPIENPRVLVFATSTAERILETINTSQADSGALNRFVVFVAEQGGIAKRYDIKPDAYTAPHDLCELVAWVSKQSCTMKFAADAWAFYKAHDSSVLDPLKFSDNRLAGRLNEQAFKTAALIALSDRREQLEVRDLRIAYAIREGLYHRVASLIGYDGALGGMHATGMALEQVRQLLAREPFLYRSQLAKRSRRFAKLSIAERDTVVRAVVRDGYAKEIGAKLESLICKAAE